MSPQAFRHVPDDGPHLGALRGTRRAQDGRHRRAARHVIDMHRSKAAFVVMRVPERQLLAAMGRAERVVDVENLAPTWRHRRTELIQQSCRQPRCLAPARRILQPAKSARTAVGGSVLGQLDIDQPRQLGVFQKVVHVGAQRGVPEQ